MTITTWCREAAVAGLNEALLAKAAQAKLLRTDKVRADTTVVEADVAYPTDSGLLAKAVGKIARTVERVNAAGGATRTSPPTGVGPRPKLVRTRDLRPQPGQDRNSAGMTTGPTPDPRSSADTAASRERSCTTPSRRLRVFRSKVAKGHRHAARLLSAGWKPVPPTVPPSISPVACSPGWRGVAAGCCSAGSAWCAERRPARPSESLRPRRGDRRRWHGAQRGCRNVGGYGRWVMVPRSWPQSREWSPRTSCSVMRQIASQTSRARAACVVPPPRPRFPSWSRSRIGSRADA